MADETDNGVSGGFAPLIRTDDAVTIRQAAAVAVVAGGDANLTQAGVGLCVAGGDVALTEAGAGTVVVGGAATLDESSVGQMAALEATVTDGRVGVLLAGSANLERSEILLSTPQAAVLGVVAGVVMFLLGRIIGRR